MKSFLKNFSFLFLGILLSVLTTILLPSTIKSVTAQLSTSRVVSFQDIFSTINQSPKYAAIKSGPLDYSLPALNINQNTSGPTPQQMDMNGDGLMDMIYSTSYGVQYATGYMGTQFVLLNNGRGFDIAYSCTRGYKTSYSGNTVSLDYTYYQGTCADTSSTQYPN